MTRSTRTREESLAETFVLLADTLVDDFDVVDLLDRLVIAAVELLGATEAGILLDDQRGHLAVIATSSEQTRLLEVFQLQSNEGPCLDCVRGKAPVVSGDLDNDRDRWPRFTEKALELGFRSVTAVPLRLRDQTIGGLNMFQDTPVAMSPALQRLAQALADVATIGILQRRTLHRSAAVAEQLQHALNSRVVIEQAKGVLAERHNIDLERAFRALRTHARNYNLKLTALAESVVRGEIDASTISPVPD